VSRHRRRRRPGPGRPVLSSKPPPMRVRFVLFSLFLGGLVPLAGCGGGSSPSGPSTPGPAEPTHQVAVTVFYDENGNGQLDGDEGARVPGVEVVIGSGRGTSAPNSGQAVVTGIRDGSHPVSVRPESLPAFYEAGPSFSAQVPGTTEARYPLSLPIGNNFPNVYLGFGDSITVGQGSSDGKGYVPKLLNLLGPHLGRAEVREFGHSGDTATESVPLARRAMRDFRPAYTLVLLGTNDWTDNQPPGCQDDVSLCGTIESLRAILEDVKAFRSLPVLATLTPVNPALAPGGRNDWIDDMNAQIRVLAQQEGALLVDANAAFMAQGDLSSLFDDDVHPNDAGYDVLARAWFEGITRSRSAAPSARRLVGFSIGG